MMCLVYKDYSELDCTGEGNSILLHVQNDAPFSVHVNLYAPTPGLSRTCVHMDFMREISA